MSQATHVGKLKIPMRLWSGGAVVALEKDMTSSC